MTPPPPLKVVFDCNVYVQALINLNGPAGRCVELARAGTVLLYASPYVLAEVREIHLKTPAKYGITAEQTEELANAIPSFASVITDVPEVYRHPIDPDDSHYVNLAIRADARLIVSRDRHLQMLADAGRPEGRESNSSSPRFGFSIPSSFFARSSGQTPSR
jgi:putative PIN family toxin of toxin-antitoxin system